MVYWSTPLKIFIFMTYSVLDKSFRLFIQCFFWEWRVCNQCLMVACHSQVNSQDLDTWFYQQKGYTKLIPWSHKGVSMPKSLSAKNLYWPGPHSLAVRTITVFCFVFFLCKDKSLWNIIPSHLIIYMGLYIYYVYYMGFHYLSVHICFSLIILATLPKANQRLSIFLHALWHKLSHVFYITEVFF